MKSVISLTVLLLLTRSTAFAAVPVSDGFNAQHDVSMFDQVPAIDFQREDVDTALAGTVEPLTTPSYKQTTATAYAALHSGVATGADAGVLAGCTAQALTCVHGESHAVGPPERAV